MIHDRVITDPDQIDASWLTAVLRRQGALTTGRVQTFTSEIKGSTWSRMVKIEPRYDRIDGQTPLRTLRLKICTSDEPVFGRSEVDYCARDYLDLPRSPIPTCFDAAYRDLPRAYHILQDDLSATHHDCHEVTPSLAHGRAVAAALARLHSHYWGEARITAAGSHRPGKAEIDRYIAQVRLGLDPLLSLFDERLDPAWKRPLRDIFTYHPRLMVERTRQKNGFTLVHGDLNPGNILAPLVGSEPVFFIDRQPFDWSVTCWLGVSDLAYMMVHWWESDLRRELEKPILRHYQEVLAGQGIVYPWEELWRDYRLAAVQSLYVAVEWCALEDERTSMRWVWEPQLHKAMAAFYDLDLSGLWQG